LPRRAAKPPLPDVAAAAGPAATVCALCERPIPEGARASRHHLTPRLKGGARRGTVLLHGICHNAIHARFNEAELARRLSDIPSLRAEPEIARFLGWVRNKPPDFHVPTRRSRGKNGPFRGRRA
jgi:5-methylcytosine-specific restriction enzyme A